MTAMVGGSHLLATPSPGASRAPSGAKGGDDGAFAETVGSVSDRVSSKGEGQADAGRQVPVEQTDDAPEPPEGKPGVATIDLSTVEPQRTGVDLLVLVSDSAMKRNESGKGAKDTSGEAAPDDPTAAPPKDDAVAARVAVPADLQDLVAGQDGGAVVPDAEAIIRAPVDSATPAKARPDLAAMLAQGGALAGQRAATTPPVTGDALRPGKNAEMASGDAMAAAADDGVDRLFRFARADGTFETFRPAEAARDGSKLPVTPEAFAKQTGMADRAAGPGGMLGERETGPTEARGGDKGIMADIAVLETKKFLGVGLAQTATAAVVNAVTENPEWNAMLRETAATSASILNGAKNASTSLKIQLSPAELGMVTATFKLSGGHMTIELKVETIEAYRQLSEDNSGIARALRGHGYDVEQITIQHVASERVQTLSGASAVQGGGQPDQAPGDGRFAQSDRERGDQGGSRRDWSQPQGEGRRGEGDARPGDGRAAGGVYL